jgi:osmotically-inducible protein OsmY
MPGHSQTDLAIRHAILEELEHDSRVDAAGIGVTVRNGVATLSGRVTTLGEVWAAEAAARRVKGVRALVQEIAVVPRPEQTSPDEALAERASNMLRWSGLPAGAEPGVSVTDGVVTLTGQVRWQHQRQEAERLVRQLSGVRAIHNQMALAPQRDVATQDISRAIGRALHRDAELERANIKIDVDGSTVTLKGTAHTWHEQFTAEQAAWSTPGVTAVVNEIQIA